MRLQFDYYDECTRCRNTNRDEFHISAYIVSFQIAYRLLQIYTADWDFAGEYIILKLKNTKKSLMLNVNTGILQYGLTKYNLVQEYKEKKRIELLKEEICNGLKVPQDVQGAGEDYLFTLFGKLVELFHARCGLTINKVEIDNEKIWEVHIYGSYIGWITSNGIAENIFGEQVSIKEWSDLRMESIAVKLFGFLRSCAEFPNPLRKGKLSTLSETTPSGFASNMPLWG